VQERGEEGQECGRYDLRVRDIRMARWRGRGREIWKARGSEIERARGQG